MSVIAVYKPICWTPLQTVERYKKSNPDKQHTSIAYAGRLDPMAEGLLLLIDGYDLKKRDEYQQLSKEYTVEMVVGIATDTHDIMGLLTNKPGATIPSDDKIRHRITEMTGTQIQKYPAFSSARVNGKPMYYWARRNELTSVSIPSKKVTVTSVEIMGTGMITTHDLLRIQKNRLTNVRGLFRQHEIQEAWRTSIHTHGKHILPVYTIHIACSSGTYIRSLVHEAGNKLGCGAICLRIIRTKVGDYSLDSAIRVE